MKVVIVMTYFDRLFQLKKTLKSIEKGTYKGLEVVIVDDGNKNPLELTTHKFPISILTGVKKSWSCSAVAYNKGLYFAMLSNPDVIILQNSECYHVGDVVRKASEVTDENYLSFSCFSLDEESTKQDHSIEYLIKINNKGASKDGQNAWYNHPFYRPVGYHFCAAITAKNMRKLNGFEERLMEGVGYEDDNFLSRVKLLGLNVEIPTNPFVVHQWHYTNGIENKSQLVEVNRNLHIEILKEKQIKAQHLYTQEL
jgi:glycosyltransferase involved in cell wall biosynthesis